MNGILKLHSVLIHNPELAKSMAVHFVITEDSAYPDAQYRYLENSPSDHCEEIRPIHPPPLYVTELFIKARSV